MRLLLAVDLGKTHCRAALLPLEGGEPLATGSAPGAPGLADPRGLAAAIAALRAAMPAGSGDAEVVVVGAAGALAAPEAARALAAALARELAADTILTSDAILAHAGALGGAPGVVLLAATGAVGVALDAGGRLVLADGAGPWLGDEGGGAWIGFAGLRAALRATDGRAGFTALEAVARERFGDLSGLSRELGAEPVRTAASFAPDVARAAAGGDETAATILAEAGRALAATATAAARRAGLQGAPVALTGGLAGLGEPLLEPLRAALDLRPAAGTPLDGARVLAAGGLPHARHAIHAGAHTPPPPAEALDRVPTQAGSGGPQSSTEALDGVPTQAGSGGPQSSTEALDRVPTQAGSGGPQSSAEPLDRVPTQAGSGGPQTSDALDRLPTEAVRPDLDDLDARPVGEVVALLVEAEGRAHEAVRRALPQLAAATEAVAARLASGGRLRYVGAGTSGRIALQDAAECAPTFGTDPALVLAIVAGGPQAARVAVEGAEDDAAAGARDLEAHGVTDADAVLGISASGRTPYVLGALRAARAAGALTVAVANAPGSPIAAVADMAVEVDTGAEVLAGSTRLTAGTTQKIVLNALSTAAMIHLGKAYGPRMVDVRATNEKLRRRALRIVAEAAAVDEAAARRALDEAGGHAKTAIVALVAGISAEEARERLARAGGHARAAIEEPAP